MREKEKIKLLKAENLEKSEWLVHAFTTRNGGVSKDNYHSLNLFSSDKNELENVIQNRKIIAENLGFNIEKLVLARQVHGKKVQVIKEEDIGKGAFSHSDAIPETDALVTNLVGVPLMLLYADCLPVLVTDIKNKAVGVVHAGWKGTEQEILRETLKTMISEYGSETENFQIAFGIGISFCCFEIGTEVREKLKKVSYSENIFAERDNRIYADLMEINISQAINFGIPKGNISYNKGLCTYCNRDLFFSYRRDNQVTGRHGAVIFIRK